MSRQSRTAFSQCPHLWPRANGLFSSTLRGILLRSERRAPNAWQCGYLGQTPQQDRESRVPTPIRWSIIPANLATGAYPSPETVNASPTLVECDSLNLPPVRTHCSACSFTSVPPPSELLKVLSSQPTLRACTDQGSARAGLQDMAMGWRCRWVRRRTSRARSLPGGVEVIWGEGAPTLVTVPFRARRRATTPRSVRPDEQTFRDDGSLAGGAVVDRFLTIHGPPLSRSEESPRASRHQSILFVPPS